ncbi:MAG: 50S ribosomal protein L20 [Candidatus Omnitrophica bacterium]|nr:50S ribosomal protein L20 [Candidatus Omnitrophota bacterium]MDD5351595.1 50S ribosomal protein L20 [Candidatus Omnitrophota bacterium]MDD5551030.1 50S ribosomal protein L20 [Candidatus Omnitrophota bacterium]
MARVKHSVRTRARKKKVMKLAKGHYGAARRWYRLAEETTARDLVYAYRDRRVKKREFRQLWISRINAACRELGTTYSQFIHKLKNTKVALDRKALADLAARDPKVFKKIVELCKK